MIPLTLAEYTIQTRLEENLDSIDNLNLDSDYNYSGSDYYYSDDNEEYEDEDD